MAVTLLYDADCGFCTRSVRWLVTAGVTAACTPLQGADLPALGVDPRRAVREIPAALGDGRVVYGADAIRAALSTGPVVLRLLAGLLGVWPVSALAPAGYGWIAAHRHRLPGGTNACAVPKPDAVAKLDLDAIAGACQRYGVQRLRIFGSALTERFDPEASDLDFLVDFAPGNTNLFHDYFDLKFELERITGQPVDLVDASAVRNPYFRASAFGSARELFAA